MGHVFEWVGWCHPMSIGAPPGVTHVVPEGVTHADPCCVCKWELPLSPALYPDRPIYLLIKKKNI